MRASPNYRGLAKYFFHSEKGLEVMDSTCGPEMTSSRVFLSHDGKRGCSSEYILSEVKGSDGTLFYLAC